MMVTCIKVTCVQKEKGLVQGGWQWRTADGRLCAGHPPEGGQGAHIPSQISSTQTETDRVKQTSQPSLSIR